MGISRPNWKSQIITNSKTNFPSKIFNNTIFYSALIGYMFASKGKSMPFIINHYFFCGSYNNKPIEKKTSLLNRQSTSNSCFKFLSPRLHPLHTGTSHRFSYALWVHRKSSSKHLWQQYQISRKVYISKL